MTAVLFIGGARSGKSGAAATLAESSGGEVGVVVFGRRNVDDEFDRRIESHVADRPGGWRTIEAAGSGDWAQTLVPTQVLLVDCVGTWLSSLAELHGYPVAEAMVIRTCEELVARPGLDVIFVTNEVGASLTPLSEIGRSFTDSLGRVNQRLGTLCDQSFLCVAGFSVPLTDLAVTPTWRTVDE